jgi:exodeoxyribonuclease III
MKIATFNANSVRSRTEPILRWLREHSPDVLCLQETKATDADFPKEPLERAGYRAAFRGEKSYNGVAILSRVAPARVQFGFDDGGPADEARLMHARFGGLHVINTYVPQGREIEHPMYAYKLEWFRRLKDLFARRLSPREDVLWLGDMNVAPQALDVHNPQRQTQHVCYHSAVRAAFADTAGWGFVDVFRKHCPQPGQYSFFDYRTRDAVRKKTGWRIDHIMATAPLARRSVRAGIDLEPRLREKPSDHTFLFAEFEGEV